MPDVVIALILADLGKSVVAKSNSSEGVLEFTNAYKRSLQPRREGLITRKPNLFPS
jgi:hypothetical protein